MGFNDRLSRVAVLQPIINNRLKRKIFDINERIESDEWIKSLVTVGESQYYFFLPEPKLLSMLDCNILD